MQTSVSELDDRLRDATTEIDRPRTNIPADRQCSTALAVLVAAMLLLIVHDARALGMGRYLSMRYWAYAIPSYFSEVVYGAPRYTYFRDLSLQFLGPGQFGDPATFQRLLTDGAAGRLHASGSPHLFPADEKGTVDFVRVAFRLFGVRVQSPFYLYCALLTLSVGVFVWRFRLDADALLTGVIAMAALYVAVHTFPITKELYSFTNPRAIGSLSLIPLVHLSLATLRRERLTGVAITQLAVQAAMIVVVVTMRTAEEWQAFALAGVAVLALAAAGASWRWSQLAPIGLTVAGLTAFGAYQVYAYPPDYFSRNLRNKLVWHNVLIGFALHPGIADWYELRVDDRSVVNLIERRASGDPRLANANIFWTPGEAPDGIVKDFREYERLARDATWYIVTAHPWQMLKLFVWYKPRMLFRSFQYAVGVGPDDLHYYELQDQAVSLFTPQERAANRAFFNPLAPAPLLIVLSACLLAGAAHVKRAFSGGTWLGLALVACASLIPAAITYPLIHVITGAYWAVALVFYAVAARLTVEVPLIRRLAR